MTVNGLTWGPHVSRFVASDGVHVTPTNSQQMPFVEGEDPEWNEAPHFEEQGVDPWDGGTFFQRSFFSAFRTLILKMKPSLYGLH